MDVENDWDVGEERRAKDSNSADTAIDGDGEFSEELGASGTAGEADPPADSVHRDIEDSYMEFSGELGPGQAFSSGMAPRLGQRSDRERVPAADPVREDGKSNNRTSAWIAIILGIGSLLFWPAILGPAAVVMGVVAYASGNKSVGVWSVALGLLSVIAYFVLLPRLY
ncbi:hypothetical protein D3C75_824980 [compost metagenome]